METKKPVNPWIVAMVASLAAFMEVLDTTITNVSLRHISGSLGAGEDEGTWVLTSYLVANAIILPLSGWLSDVLGRKRFFIGCIMGFTLASFFCGTATSLTGLILFRIFQGAAGGGLQPTQQAIILDIFPPEKRGLVFAITGITMIVAPILGPTLGGIITDHISWRWIFYINVPVGLLSSFMVWKLVEDPPHAEAKGFKKIDFPSLGFVSLGLAALQIVLDKGQQDDWLSSPFIFSWALICLVSLVIAIIWLRGQTDPIIDLSLFSDIAFSCSCILIFLVGFVLYGSTALLPIMLERSFGYTSTLVGLVLSPAGFAVLFLMPIVGKLSGKIRAKYLILFGLSIETIGMFYSSHFSPDTDFQSFMLIRVTQLLGLPFLFIPISTLAFTNVLPNKRNKASALFSLARNLGGSVGIAVVSTFATRRQQMHQTFLGESLIPGNVFYEDLLLKYQEVTGAIEPAKDKIYQILQEQSSIMAYSDCYVFLTSLLIITAIFSLLFLPSYKITAPAAGEAPAH